MPLHHLSLGNHARTMTRIFDEHRLIFGVQDVIFGVQDVIFGAVLRVIVTCSV